MGGRVSRAACALAALCTLFPRGAAAQDIGPPPVSVLQDSGPLANGYVFIGEEPTAVPNPIQGPAILDNAGRVVWFSPVPAGQVATDFRVQTYMGNPVLTWSQASSFGAVNPMTTVDYILDKTYTVIGKVQGVGFNADMHEFYLTPQGTALIVIYNTMQADLSSVGGPVNGMVTEGVVQEVDVATGALLLEWHSLPEVALSESYEPVPAAAGSIYDYFHINSASLDTDGNILVSSRHCWTVYKINRTTGALMWRLGGKKSDFALGTGLPFAWQHDVVAVDANTIRIFDNESDGVPVLPYSRVLWVTHDDTAMTASVAQQIVHPDMLSVIAEGCAQGLGNGDTFVEWGILGRYSEFNAAGQLLYDAAQAPGYSSYRGYRFAWTGAPSTLPTANALQDSDGTTAVHAVWNGATAVASWQVMGGASSTSLVPVATAPWNGMDTEITVPGGTSTFEVVALDASGATLATSAPVSGPFAAVFPTQPASQTIAGPATVTFSAAATGAQPYYQWMFNGTPVVNGPGTTGANTPRLVLNGATAANAGVYTCVATNGGSAATSDPATLTVVSTPDVGRLVNASVRAGVQAGEGALIIGFAVGGPGTSGTEHMLVRASGPVLATLGVAGALADPELDLYTPAGVVTATVGSTPPSATATPAAASKASMYAFLPESFGVGPYTAVVSGASGDTGIALAEVFDTRSDAATVPSTPHLTNISGRAAVAAGDNAVIAGFVIGGTTSETVLIRASGPALGSVGVTGTLADPQLQLTQSNSDGSTTVVATNAGWGGDPQVAAAAAAVGAFPWASAASADSAILVTLPPGTYTAVVTGASGDSGVALVEAYEVP